MKPFVMGLACLSLLLPNPTQACEPPWTPLFSGKDLTGWHVACKPKDLRSVFWKADGGTILCDSMGRSGHDYVWLVSDQEYGDFELRLQFQVFRDSPGNSGLQFRSRYDASAPGGGYLDGPQVDIHPPAAMNWRTGLIYDETRTEHRWISPSLRNAAMEPRFKPDRFVFKYADEGDGWNTLTLRCQGLHVTTTVNGIVRTDWDGTGVLDNPGHVAHRVGRVGYLALQLHSGDQLRIRFKGIEIRGL